MKPTTRTPRPSRYLHIYDIPEGYYIRRAMEGQRFQKPVSPDCFAVRYPFVRHRRWMGTEKPSWRHGMNYVA